LRKQGSSDHYREVIGSMLEESGRLGRLVDSLLTIARADSGQIQISRKSMPLAPFVCDAISLLEVLAEEKGQRLLFDGDADARVEADPMVLRQVIINLLDNAIKYSPVGGTITTRVLRVRNKVALEVEDSGPGIPVEHREKVFDRFYRVDESRSREAGGAGLGLAIARWGAHAHGGELELECPPGGGCVFRVVLPAGT
jgi:signal transduction histidine kinase